MFKDFLVSTPDEKGKITTQTRKTQAGKTVYILYEIGRTYNAAKKYNVPHRVVIGKADPNDPEKMYPNEKYFEHFPQTVDKVEPTEENSLRSCALEIGSFIVIDKIIKHYKLDKIASDWFGKDAGLFLDLAAYMIVTEDNVGQYYPGYAFNHPLFTEGMRLVSDSKVSRFLSSVTKDQIFGFLDDWNEDKDHQAKVYTSYDSTNKNSQAGDLNIVEYGKPNLDEKKCPFVMMVKGCKQLVSSIIKEHRHRFESKRDCFISAYHVYGTSVKAAIPGMEKEHQRYFHLYYSSGKAAGEREKLENLLEKMKQEIRKMEGKQVLFGGRYEHYFDFHYGKNKELLFARERPEVIEQELDLCGYFSIITSEEMSAQDAYLLYKGRDSTEKLFRADKSYLGSKSLRICSNAALDAKTLIGFTALIIRNRIYSLLKHQMLKLNIRRNYMTVPAAIVELNKLEMVKLGQGDYQLHHAITKTQKTILSSFGISLEDVQVYANQIARILKTKVKEAELEDEDYEDGEICDDAY